MDEAISMDEVIKRLEALGAKGLVVSIAYGPFSGDQQYRDVPGAEKGDLLYSVDVQWPNGSIYRRPYAGKTFDEAVTIAEEAVALAEEGAAEREEAEGDE